jgi:hypothetical protein
MDVFNPDNEKVSFHILIGDSRSGLEYDSRFDVDFNLEPGMNYLSIPTDSIRTNIQHRLLNLKGLRKFMVFVPDNLKPRELYLDNIRLE